MQITRWTPCLLYLLAVGCPADSSSPNPTPEPASDAAVGTPGVGESCLPEQVPETGFDEREAYIESSSKQCQTHVCMVFRLRGDPRAGCVEAAPSTNCDPMADPECAPGTHCAAPDEIEKRIYCTCRCNSADTGFEECACPDGFSCVDVLEQGGPGTRGGYCVKDGTFSTF